MPPKKRSRTQKTTEQDDPATQRLSEGSVEGEISQEEGKMEESETVKLLKERIAQGDSEAMLLLAECYALGRDAEQNRVKAEELISCSAKKGNKEAQSLVRLLKKWRKETTMDMTRLFNKHDRKSIKKTTIFIYRTPEREA